MWLLLAIKWLRVCQQATFSTSSKRMLNYETILLFVLLSVLLSLWIFFFPRHTRSFPAGPELIAAPVRSPQLLACSLITAPALRLSLCCQPLPALRCFSGVTTLPPSFSSWWFGKPAPSSHVLSLFSLWTAPPDQFRLSPSALPHGQPLFSLWSFCHVSLLNLV